MRLTLQLASWAKPALKPFLSASIPTVEGLPHSMDTILGASKAVVLTASCALSPATSWATSFLIVSAITVVSTDTAAADDSVPTTAKASKIRLGPEYAERFIRRLPWFRTYAQENS